MLPELGAAGLEEKRAAGARRRVLRGGRLVGLAGRLLLSGRALLGGRRVLAAGAAAARAPAASAPRAPVGTGAYFTARSGVNAGRPDGTSEMLRAASPSVPFSPGRIGS